MAVVVLCVDNIESPKRCLILKRGSTAPWAPSQWSLPGGLIDGKEDPLNSRGINGKRTEHQNGRGVPLERHPTPIVAMAYIIKIAGGRTGSQAPGHSRDFPSSLVVLLCTNCVQ